MSDLIESINLCDTIESIRILQNNPNINLEEKDEYNRTALHISCFSKLSEISHLLLKKGADILNQGENGNYPLHYAVLGNDFKIIKKIISNNFDPELPNNKGETALHLAIQEGNYEIVNYLLFKSDLHVKDSEGNSALHKITSATSYNIFSLLLSNGANIKDLNNNKDNILHILAKQTSFNLYLEQIMRICLDNKLDILQKNIENDSPIEIALKMRNTPFLKVLKEHNPDIINNFFKHNNSIMNEIINNKNIFFHLLDSNIISFDYNFIFTLFDLQTLHKCIEKDLLDINHKEQLTGLSRLHLAVINNEVDIVNFLIKNNADINIKDIHLNTPLHYIKKNTNIDIAEILIHNGANVDQINDEGISPRNELDIHKIIILQEQKELKKSFTKK